MAVHLVGAALFLPGRGRDIRARLDLAGGAREMSPSGPAIGGNARGFGPAGMKPADPVAGESPPGPGRGDPE